MASIDFPLLAWSGVAVTPRRQAPLYLAGIAIGFLAAFLGIGGGVAIVPLLVLGYGLDQRKAAGTSLGIVTFVVSAGVIMGVVDPAPAGRPALIAVVAVVPTAILAVRAVTPHIHRIPVVVLRRGFAVIMLIAAAKLFELPPFSASQEGGLFSYESLGVTELVVLPVLGLCIGAVSTLVGIGGGLLLIPALAFLFNDLSWQTCRATSLLVVAPTAFMGFTRHLGQGTADIRFVRPIVPACVVGSFAGSFAAHRADPELFQRVFGAFLVAVALKLFLSTPPQPVKDRLL